MRTPVLQTQARHAALAAAVSALALSACSTFQDQAPRPLTPLSRYSLQVEPGLDRIALAVHESGLSGNQQSAVVDLARRYFTSGAGVVVVQGPSGGDPVSAERTWGVKAALEAAGVPGDRIQVVAYEAPDPRAPILVGFETLTAYIPNCASQRGNMSGGFTNETAPGFGCAVTANMAAQIDNPRDIVQPRAMTPAETGRAAVVFDNYRRGQRSSGAQEQLVEGRISRAVE